MSDIITIWVISRHYGRNKCIMRFIPSQRSDISLIGAKTDSAI